MILNKGWLAVVLAAGSLGGCGMFGGGSTCAGWTVKASTPTGTACSTALPPSAVTHDASSQTPAAAAPTPAPGAASTAAGL